MKYPKYKDNNLSNVFGMFLIFKVLLAILMVRPTAQFEKPSDPEWVKDIKRYRREVSKSYKAHDANYAESLDQIYLDDKSPLITIVGKAKIADKHETTAERPVKLRVKKTWGSITIQINEKDSFPLDLVDWSVSDDEAQCVHMTIADTQKKEWNLSFNTRCSFLKRALIHHIHTSRLIWEQIDDFWKEQNPVLKKARVMEIRFHPTPPIHFRLFFYAGRNQSKEHPLASYAIENMEATKTSNKFIVSGMVLINHKRKQFRYRFPLMIENSIIKGINAGNEYDHVIPLRRMMTISGQGLDHENLIEGLSVQGYSMVAWKNKQTRKVEQLAIMNDMGNIIWDVFPENSNWDFNPDSPICFTLDMLYEGKVDENFYAKEFCDLLVMDLFSAQREEIAIHDN